MKAIIIILLFGISFSYNRTNAIKYAKKYCNYRGPYYDYHYQRDGENANFVSKCLVAGGQKFDGCAGRDSKGMFLNIQNLKNCLLKKGWKKSISKHPEFKAGYPIFLKNIPHVMLATGFDSYYIIYCAHASDRCDAKIDAKSVEYFYL